MCNVQSRFPQYVFDSKAEWWMFGDKESKYIVVQFQIETCAMWSLSFMFIERYC
jgi:hypothetical protein